MCYNRGEIQPQISGYADASNTCIASPIQATWRCLDGYFYSKTVTRKVQDAVLFFDCAPSEWGCNMGRIMHHKHYLCPEGMNYCTKCDTHKLYSDFSVNPNGPNGRNWQCKKCINESGKKYSDTRVLLDKKKNYGIEPKEYLRLLELQGGVCAICGEPETHIHKGKLAFLAVDHNHQTGKIRGLLCHACNCGLGQFRDDRNLVEKALNYLYSTDDERTQNQRGEIDMQLASKRNVEIDELMGAVRGLPKKIRGNVADVENLPLFSGFD